MEHLLDDELLCHEERITLSLLLASQNARRADREQEALQDELRQMIDERRQVIDPTVEEKAALDQQPYVSAQHKGRRTVTLGPEQACPVLPPPPPPPIITPELEPAQAIPMPEPVQAIPTPEPVKIPAPRGIIASLRAYLKDWAIRNL